MISQSKLNWDDSDPPSSTESGVEDYHIFLIRDGLPPLFMCQIRARSTLHAYRQYYWLRTHDSMRICVEKVGTPVWESCNREANPSYRVQILFSTILFLLLMLLVSISLGLTG